MGDTARYRPLTSTLPNGMFDLRIAAEFDARAPFALADATLLVLANIGSHSHGTYVPPTDPRAIDDVDYMGIVIPPVSYTLGIRTWDGVNFMRDELDCVFYSFRKFVALLVKSNPNVLGLLWLRPDCWTVRHALWGEIVAARELFSSLDAYPAFTGYAYGQMKRMTAFDLAAQREWQHVNALVEAAGWTRNDIVNDRHLVMPNVSAVRALLPPDPNDADPDATVNAALQEARVRLKHLHAKHFQGYLGEKRKALVTQHGYNTKNAAHLIRLMRMCVEFLGTGTLTVYRTEDAAHLRDIKAGRVALADVQAEAEALFAEAKVIKERSPLPASPDVAAIDALVVRLHRDVYGVPVAALADPPPP